MARLPRIIIPDVPHHVTQRGNRRLPVLPPGADEARAETEATSQYESLV